MDLALVERLVCPEPHATSPLIVRADVVDAGRLVRGVLGCAECRREWSVENGAARFGDPAPFPAPTQFDADALAAFLGLSDPMFVLVDGADDATMHTLAHQYSASLVALDTETSVAEATVVLGAKRVPLAAAAVRAALLLRARDDAFLSSAVESVAAGGHVVGHASITLPAGLREIARDAALWVAVREVVTKPVELRRG